MKKTLSIVMSFAIILLNFQHSVSAKESESTNVCANKCNTIDLIEESTFINDDGNLVKNYTNGLEVEYKEDGSITIKDYGHVYGDNELITRGPWIAIGKAIIEWTIKIVSACSTIEYVTGFDICRIVISHIIAPDTNKTIQYELTGQYIQKKIPGCVPMHSAACNGYWEYNVVIVG